MIIIDAVPLQRRGVRMQAELVLVGLVKALAGWDRVRFLLTRRSPIPGFMSKMGDQLVYALPNNRDPITLVGLQCRLDELQTSMRLQQAEYIRLAGIKPTSPGDASGSCTLECEGLTLPLYADDLKVEAGVELSGLDLMVAEELGSDLSNYIMLDSGVAFDLDLLRKMVSLARQLGVKLIVPWACEGVLDSEAKKIYYSPSLINHLSSQVTACVVLDGGEVKDVNVRRAINNGGRVLKIARGKDPKSLDEFEVCAEVQPNDAVQIRSFFEALPPKAAKPLPEVLRIALVTPMFPDKGGPPHSSLDLALELTKICDLDVWTDSLVLPQHARQFENVYRLDNPFVPERYDEIIYVLGNHRMYERIYSMMKKYGGVVIQHDAHMLDFINFLEGSAGLSALIKREADIDYTVTSITKLISDLDVIGVPLLSSVLEPASSVVVHSPTSRDVIAENYDVDVSYLPVGMPYPFKQEQIEPEARKNAKIALGVDLGRPCIVSFGEVHLLKGAKQCLLALAELHGMGAPFQFYFVGPVQAELRLELERIRDDLGLNEVVTFTDGVSEENYIKFLQAGDIVLQIRQIPFGQLSGALLDAVSAGMHGVSSEGLAKAIEAPDTVVRVNDKASNFVYAEALYQLIQSKNYNVRPAPSWEEFSKKHDFAVYAKNLLSRIFRRGQG